MSRKRRNNGGYWDNGQPDNNEVRNPSTTLATMWRRENEI
jgi:hypothetical protein